MDHSNLSKSGTAALLYGIASYGVVLGVFVYAVAFIGGLLTPARLDTAPGRPFWQALAIDLGLLGLFFFKSQMQESPGEANSGAFVCHHHRIG